MSYSPFARFRNFTKENLKSLLDIYPDMYEEMSWTEAKEIINNGQSNYKQTAYQQACQFGLEDRGDDTFRIQNYLYTLNDDGLEKYLKFWFKLYYAPNPYVRADIDDVPSIIYCELAKRILNSDSLSVDYGEYFDEVFGAGSSDILLNAISAYGNPIKVKRENGITTLYVEESDVEELKNDVERIERLFPIGNAVSKRDFFERFCVDNFKLYYNLTDYSELLDDNKLNNDITNELLVEKLKDTALDNKKWIFLCLETLKENGILTGDILEKLIDFNFCKTMFKLYHTPVLVSNVDEDTANRVYSNDKFVLSEGTDFFVSKEWFNDPTKNAKSHNNRSLFTNWVLEKITGKTKVLKYVTNVTSEYSLNRIIFGAPGTGKSYQLETEKKNLLTVGSYFERVTFHPDYTYANFVGTYKPVMVNSCINNIGDDYKSVVSVLADESKTAQEKYDLLYDRFKNDGLTRLPILLGLYTDEAFKTKKLDGTDAANDNGVERNHGKALRPYVSLLSSGVEKEEIAYKYVPGPFMRVLVSALKNPRQAHLLLIEEINRANVAAVFGDVFQLLDRDKNGVSEYEIHTSEDMRKHLAEELNVNDEDVESIKLPNNLFIWATMNSADQGVYPMDTAFKRRWDFEYIGIDDGEDKMKDFEFSIHGQTMKWNELRVAINNALTNANINEDKLLGPFFIDKNILDAKDNDKFIRAFCNKVIMYLFEDAARTKRNDIFAKGENKLTYSKLCADFRSKGKDIFVESIRDAVDFTVVQDENINS